MAFDQFTAAGADAAQWGYRAAGGWFAGKDNLTTADTGDSSPMARLRGLKSADISLPDPTEVQVTGDNTVLQVFTFDSGTKPTFNLETGVTDFTFEGAIQNLSPVIEAGKTMLPFSVPSAPQQPMIMIFTRDAASQDVATYGDAGYDHLILLNVGIKPLGGAFTYQGEKVQRYRCTLNDSLLMPDGRTISSVLGVERAGAIMMTSQNRITYTAFVGDGTVKIIVPEYEPVSLGTTLATIQTTNFATDTVASIDTTDPFGVTLTGTPASGKYAVALTEFVQFT